MEFFNFKLSKNSVIELVYDLDNKFLSYYLQYERPKYPGLVYFKFSTDHTQILEYYPYFFKSINTSLQIFMGCREYDYDELGIPFVEEYRYLSYDGRNIPTQMYDGWADKDTIVRTKNSQPDGIYITVNNSEFEEMFSKVEFPDHSKELIRKYNPTYVILFLDKDKKFLKYLMGFDNIHPKYKEIINEYNIPFFKKS